MKTRIHRVDTLEEARKLLEGRAGIVELSWCGNEECGHRLEEQVHAKVLGTPLDMVEEIKSNCIMCGSRALNLVRVAVAY